VGHLQNACPPQRHKQELAEAEVRESPFQKTITAREHQKVEHNPINIEKADADVLRKMEGEKTAKTREQLVQATANVS